MTTEIATQAGHWYARDGSPKYTTIGLNGQERPTTLRDARKLGLLPSVTTIMREAAAPGLEKWRRDQLLMAALTLPRIEGEGLDAFAKRVQEDANAQGEKARQTGTDGHGALERAFQGLSYDQAFKPHVEAVFAALEPYRGSGWLPERSFASPLGYAGKIDLYSDLAVCDYKFKTFDETAVAEKLAWPEMDMQLSAYNMGLTGELVRINVFVSTTVPGLVKLHKWPDDDTAWEKFKCLLRYWQLSKGYAPTSAPAVPTTESER